MVSPSPVDFKKKNMMKTEDFSKNLNSVSKMLNEKMQTKNRQQPDRSHYRLALPDPKQFI